MKLQSDIGHFPSICGTCPNKNRYVPPNCPDGKCARPRTGARTRNCNAIAKPGPEVSTWLHRQQMLVATSSHEEKSIALPDSNVALLRDRLAVKPRYRPALVIILPHPFLVRFISCFTFPLLDWLFTDGRCETSLHNRTSRRTLASSTATRQPRTQASRIALQSNPAVRSKVKGLI